MWSPTNLFLYRNGYYNEMFEQLVRFKVIQKSNTKISNSLQHCAPKMIKNICRDIITVRNTLF